MEGEASSFESSEMLATLVGSTPLLWKSWKVCGQANTKAAGAGAGADERESFFVINRKGSATYVGFSSSVSNSSSNNLLVELDKAAPPHFSALLLHPHHHQHPQIHHHPVMVHAGFLHLFLSILNLSTFQHQLFESIKVSKSVVFTGHSIGGTTASLSALWLLSYLQSNSNSNSSSSFTNINVMCITFGSPLLGNHSLSRAILRERWAGNFCHVVANCDIVPRLLFVSPPPPLSLLELQLQLPDDEKNKLFFLVLAACAQAAASAKQLGEKGETNHNCFWPFGSYMLCSNKGAVCLDNDMAIVKLLHLMLATASSPTFSIEDHLSYHVYVSRASNSHFLKSQGLMEEGDLARSSYEAGLTLALQSLGISTTAGTCQEEASAAKDCLRMAKRMGMGIGMGVRTPNLKSATLAITLSKITPLRAQIEWYKASCDESNDGMGYYDTFKQRALKRDAKVNMNRIKLARFWDDIIHMLETNQLPLNFHKRAKWVNAAHFYQLLVEPLDIAEYYRMGMHKKKGHYLKHGRERRHEIFDRWWRNRDVGDEENNNKRSSFASLTQDSCFWARVEEAREWLEDVSKSEADTRKLSLLWEDIDEFEEYARGIIDRKEASRDVLAKNSSYSLWINEWRQVKSQLYQHFPTQFPGFVF